MILLKNSSDYGKSCNRMDRVKVKVFPLLFGNLRPGGGGNIWKGAATWMGTANSCQKLKPSNVHTCVKFEIV